MGDPLVIIEGNPQPLGADATRSAWNDLSVPLTQGKQGNTAKPDYDYTNLAFLFPQNDPDEILYLTFQIPHFWRYDSIIYPHVHWHQSADQNVTWKIDYRWTNLSDAVSGTWTTYVMDQPAVEYTAGTIHQLSAGTEGIDGTGKALSSELQVKLYRDDNVYTGDAPATMFDIHIEIDSFGSELQFTKYA